MRRGFGHFMPTVTAFAAAGMTTVPSRVILYMPTKEGTKPHRKYKEDSIMTHKLITTLLCLSLIHI